MKIKKITPFLFSICAICFPATAQTSMELLEQGRDAYLDYDFSEASRLYSLAKKKAKADDHEFNDTYNLYTRQLSTAKNFLNRVEKLAVIDSITVSKADFFKHYRLPASSGSLEGKQALPPGVKGDVNYVFTNENEDYKLWAQPDSTGRFQIVESSLLTDGRWSEPALIDEELSEESDAIYPFMMADGVTLYYADNGENSIGGYDIMVATRDAADGTFLQPSNLGFPYNSPFDDYLLAIDELNGVGWWATDRNQLEDEITIYVFVVNELRDNYPPDEDNITDFARIDDYIATQPEDADYDELLSTIRSIDPTKRNKKPEFRLPTSKGRIYYRFEELPTSSARSAMKKYLAAKDEFEKTQAKLAEMRKQFREYRSENIAARIREEEKKTELQRKELAGLLSEVYKEL